MIIKWHLWRVVLIIALLRIERICPDEIVSINAKKSLHLVSEQFISISVDPAILFDNSNFSSNTLELAKALSPAFIRFTGPSTDTIQWSESRQYTNDGYKITPEKWIALNKWAMDTNLTPIFALNGNQRINGVWDPRDSLDIMILTDKMNFSCFWELGYDCSNSTLSQYIADITSLNHILDAFPSSKDFWGTIGSDFSGCLEQVSYETIKNFLISVEDLVDAINWHINITNNNLFNEKDPIVRALAPTSKISLPVMLTVPASEDPTSYHEALIWASRLGDTARHGFGIIFKQLTFEETLQDTPAYWLTLVHKHLMGRNVLDVHTNNVTMYAHCARNQNAYSRRGAVAMFGVNPYEGDINMTVKFIGHSLKSNQIHSYILTTDETNSEIFLNDEKMTPIGHIRNGRLNISPKIRQSKPGRHLNINLPPKSIGFFILPSARVPACILNEDNKELVLEEIIEDQNMMSSVFSKLQDTKNEINIDDNLSDDGKNKLKHRKNDEKVKNIRKHFLDHAKHYEKKNMEHNKIELKHMLQEKIREEKHKEKSEKFNFESSDENNNFNLENEFDSEHNTVKKDKENTRKKRFLPVDILQDFAIKNKKDGSNEKNKDVPKNRQKRDLDFGTSTKKRGRLIERFRKRNDENEFKMIDITETKSSKKIPEGDVYIDFKNGDTETEEKNENYDYIETEENYDSYEEAVLPVKFIEPNTTDRKKTHRSNKTNNNKREAEAKRRSTKYSNVDGMELIKQTQNPNEWLDLDANDNFYHVPNEFYENLQLTNVNIRDDLRVYGELWEIDNFKDVIDMTDQDVGEDEDILQYDESAGLTEDPYLVDNAKNHFNKYMQESSKILRSKKSSKEISESMSIDEISMKSDAESMDSDEEDIFRPSPSQIRETKVIPDRKMESYKNYIESERIKYDEIKKENSDTQYKKKKSMSTTSTPSTTSTTTTTPEPSSESEEIITTARPRTKKSRRPDQVQMYERFRFKRDLEDSLEEPNQKIKRNLEKQQMKTYKNQLKQKHAIERHVRKIDHKEEKRILKHLKNRYKRDVSDTQSTSNENINSVMASIEQTENINEIPDREYLQDNFNEEQMLFELDFEATESPLETQTFVPYFDVEENQIVDEIEENKSNESYEPLRFVIGKPFDQIRFKHVSDRRISNFQKYLKNRLARQRKRLEKLKPIIKVPENDVLMTTDEDNIAATTEIPNIEQTDENVRLVRNVEKSDLIKLLRSRVPRKTSPITEGRTALKRSPVNENIVVSDVPLLRSLLGRQLPKDLQRNKRSLDDNEIFSDEKEKYYKTKWYKIPTPEGKKIVEYEKLKFHKKMIDTDSDKFITETLNSNSNENKSNNDEVFIFESTNDDSTPSKDADINEGTGNNIKSLDVQNLIRENEEYPTMIIFETDTTTDEYPIIIETYSNSDFGIPDEYQYINSDEIKKLISPENQDAITENVIIIPDSFDDSFSSEESDQDDSGFSVFSREKKERKPTSIFGKITPKTRFFDTFLQTISGLLDRVQKRLFGPFGLLR